MLKVFFICLILTFLGCTGHEKMAKRESRDLPPKTSYKDLEKKWELEDKAYFNGIKKKIGKISKEDIMVKKTRFSTFIYFGEYELQAFDADGRGIHTYELTYKEFKVPLSWKYNNEVYNILKEMKKELRGKTQGQIFKEKQDKAMQEVINGD